MSVVIPTYNSSSTLEACLKSLKAQTYPNIEIIVVDNYSTDVTRKIAERYGVKTLLKGPERSAQMNHGVMNAGGEYILRVDSDMVADEDVIEKCIELCHMGVDAVVLPVLPHPSTLNSFWTRCRMLEQKMLIDDLVNVAPRFMKRSVFLAVGGYDETIVAWEDYDLHNRLLASKYRLDSLRDSSLWHLSEPASLKQVVSRMLKYGKTGSLGAFAEKHGSMGLRQIFIIRPSYIRHRRYFLSDPSHFIGLMFMKLVQMFSVALGALSGQ